METSFTDDSEVQDNSRQVEGPPLKGNSFREYDNSSTSMRHVYVSHIPLKNKQLEWVFPTEIPEPIGDLQKRIRQLLITGIHPVINNDLKNLASCIQTVLLKNNALFSLISQIIKIELNQDTYHIPLLSVLVGTIYRHMLTVLDNSQELLEGCVDETLRKYFCQNIEYNEELMNVIRILLNINSSQKILIKSVANNGVVLHQQQLMEFLYRIKIQYQQELERDGFDIIILNTHYHCHLPDTVFSEINICRKKNEREPFQKESFSKTLPKVSIVTDISEMKEDYNRMRLKTIAKDHFPTQQIQDLTLQELCRVMGDGGFLEKWDTSEGYLNFSIMAGRPSQLVAYVRYLLGSENPEEVQKYFEDIAIVHPLLKKCVERYADGEGLSEVAIINPLRLHREKIKELKVVNAGSILLAESAYELDKRRIKNVFSDLLLHPSNIQSQEAVEGMFGFRWIAGRSRFSTALQRNVAWGPCYWKWYVEHFEATHWSRVLKNLTDNQSDTRQSTQQKRLPRNFFSRPLSTVFLPPSTRQEALIFSS
ncbi:MAG: hypothetical protein P1V18_00095 [Candidatus Gracilibacteria bacterium]|nr:hypothetical protein [Candidatus Gracilibacteria bacterium]